MYGSLFFMQSMQKHHKGIIKVVQLVQYIVLNSLSKKTLHMQPYLQGLQAVISDMKDQLKSYQLECRNPDISKTAFQAHI